MVRTLNVPVDDEVYERLKTRKENRNETWPEFLAEVSRNYPEVPAES